MLLEDPDRSARVAAFAALERLIVKHGPVLRWDVLSEGFLHEGEMILFGSTPRGIHRPRQMRGGALSIKTTVPKAGRQARYDDQVASDEGYFVYKLQGDDADARDNRWLAESYRLQAPMIYFYGIDPGLYRPLWPVFIISWNPSALECVVAADDGIALATDSDESLIRRRYATVGAKKRLHQDAFRALVLRAYQTRCAVCRLPGIELVEAAHIVPDRDERGRPEVPNGLALCRLHHGAFDTNLLGIRPDLVVEIAPRLMAEKDGPVLEHGLKGFHGKSIHMPERRGDWPRADYLDERYSLFRAA